MKLVKSPANYEVEKRPVVFLAGTIDNGESDDWQKQVTDSLAKENVLVLNPRRDSWDSTWQQSIKNPQFKEQVEWELAGLEKASVIFLYLAPGSKSPISLLEFGLHVKNGNIVVVCPDGFWRKGNIEVVCHRYNVKVYNDIGSGISALIAALN